MIKDRDEAWTRVETLAKNHPNYVLTVNETTNNPFLLPQHMDSSLDNTVLMDEDELFVDQNPLTVEKIEAKAQEVVENPS